MKIYTRGTHSISDNMEEQINNVEDRWVEITQVE